MTPEQVFDHDAGVTYLCFGGPLHGQAFTAKQWRQRVARARVAGPADRATARNTLGYERGTQVKPPTLPKALRDGRTVIALIWRERP